MVKTLGKLSLMAGRLSANVAEKGMAALMKIDFGAMPIKPGGTVNGAPLEIVKAIYLNSRGTEPMVTRVLSEIAKSNNGNMIGLDYRMKSIATSNH
ncbi:hypothetical protein ACO0K9_20810 [Undibacterium sp. Ji50W]|uniref:hypothetical protein n=1 Tax=Undibacterium sp. Ji50W TaxID=3413041 RepID=UPI003BEFD21E